MLDILEENNGEEAQTAIKYINNCDSGKFNFNLKRIWKKIGMKSPEPREYIDIGSIEASAGLVGSRTSGAVGASLGTEA